MQAMIRMRKMLSPSWKKLAGHGAGWLAAVVIAMNCSHNVSGNEDSARPAAQSATVTTVPLEYRETNYQTFLHDLLFRDVPVEARSSPFPKEPDLASGKVVRGVLKFGDNPSNAIAFLWQPGAQKLFLDLNRNWDLTDDADGVFFGSLTGPRIPTINHQVFTNIHLSFPATSAGAPMLVDLNFFQNGESGRPLVNVMERSYWQGKVTVAGHEWEMGLLQNISDQPGSFERGQLLLRPWEERDKVFSGWSDSVDAWAIPFEYRNRVLKAADAFEFSRQIFFEGHAWRLDWNAEPAADGAPFAVRLTEQQPALGELRITGRFIERLVLTGGPYAVVLVRPAGSVKIPVGSYNQPSVWLKQGQDEAYFDSLPKSGKRTVPNNENLGGIRPISGVAEAGKVVVVDERRPAVLTMGGPLTNSISVTRHGRDLNLTYRLIGAEGGDYKLWEYWRTKSDSPPQFTIYQGEKKIGSGNFEFG
jgi:hypothetical protein